MCHHQSRSSHRVHSFFEIIDPPLNHGDFLRQQPRSRPPPPPPSLPPSLPPRTKMLGTSGVWYCTPGVTMREAATASSSSWPTPTSFLTTISDSSGWSLPCTPGTPRIRSALYPPMAATVVSPPAKADFKIAGQPGTLFCFSGLNCVWM